MVRNDFFYDSRDSKSKIHAVKWIPEGDPIGIIVLVHGMAEYIGRYEHVAEFFCSQGFIVTGNDHLGHGESSKDSIRGYICKQDPATVVVRDVHRLKKTIQSEYPSLPIFIYGHSMGSLITRNYLTKYGSGVQGAVICGTLMMPKPTIYAMGAILGVLTMFKGSRHVSRFMNNMAFGSYCKRIDNKRTEFDWLTRDVEMVNRYIADPLCGFIFTLNGFSTLKSLLLRLHDRSLLERIPKDLPVLFIYGMEDPCGDYGQAVRAVVDQYKGLGIKDVEAIEYDGYRHELHNEIGKEKVMEDVNEWIKKHV